MQNQPLLVSSIIRHAARHHGHVEVVSRLTDRSIHRTTYAEIEHRSRRVAKFLQQLEIAPGDCVGTLAWNDFRHLELYYGISGMGAVCHTVNPRLYPDDIAYIINHAGDRLLFVDPFFAPLVAQIAPAIAGTVREIIVLASPDLVPDIDLPRGMGLTCYEQLMAGTDASFAWPTFDENTASSLCYTSGTTGRPKGVLYSHRSTVLHALGANQPDGFGFRAVDRIMPCASMYHATAWGTPYVAPMVGAALILPGRHMDGPSLHDLIESERVTYSIGVPTIWTGLLPCLDANGQPPATLRRIAIGGSAVPRQMIRDYARYNITIEQIWGMTEMSPMGVYNQPSAATFDLSGQAAERLRVKQGRGVFGVEMKILDSAGKELPWDGEAFGDLLVRGPWICREYLKQGLEGAADADGWFRTGDVATIDPNGYLEIVDRAKDVIKSGGEWISSITLENIAIEHPQVAEAASIAARHPRWMERPLLLVVPKGGNTLDPEEVKDLIRARVPGWWLPDAVLVVDSLPRNPTGKLNKLALREQFGDFLLQ
jgi:fatty-acyl-CoA synthase